MIGHLLFCCIGNWGSGVEMQDAVYGRLVLIHGAESAFASLCEGHQGVILIWGAYRYWARAACY